MIRSQRGAAMDYEGFFKERLDATLRDLRRLASGSIPRSPDARGDASIAAFPSCRTRPRRYSARSSWRRCRSVARSSACGTFVTVSILARALTKRLSFWWGQQRGGGYQTSQSCSHLKPSYGAGIRSRISSFGRHYSEIRGVFGKRLRYREQPSTRPQNGCARSTRERVISPVQGVGGKVWNR
jgi:hypothetical protein